VYKGVLLHQTQVRTGNFAQGVYLIKIDGVKAVEFRKIVKK
jgi:hypothetical protein